MDNIDFFVLNVPAMDWWSKVEAHIRRLAAPLLLRVGERVRRYKEAPLSLRLGVRRASKGYGHRITRQCVVSSGVAAAWGMVREDVAVAAAAAAGGMPELWKSEGAAAARGSPVGDHRAPQWQPDADKASAAGAEARDQAKHFEGSDTAVGDYPRPRSSPVAGSTSSVAGSVGPTYPLAAVVRWSPEISEKPAVQTQQQRDHGDAAGEALLEVIRLAMSMFDKIFSPEERLDITLLSVGFTGFRALGGSAQAGIAR